MAKDGTARGGARVGAGRKPKALTLFFYSDSIKVHIQFIDEERRIIYNTVQNRTVQ